MPSATHIAVQATMPLLHAAACALQPPQKSAAQCSELVLLLTQLPDCAATLAQVHNGGQSCLMEAVFQASDGMVAALLDAHNSNAKAVSALARHKDSAGQTALHICAAHGRMEVARQVLDVDAALCNTPAASGMTPLMVAAQAQQVKMMLFLLLLGAPPEAAVGSPDMQEALQKAEQAKAAQAAGSAAQQSPASVARNGVASKPAAAEQNGRKALANGAAAANGLTAADAAAAAADAPAQAAALAAQQASTMGVVPQQLSIVVDVLARCKHGRTALHYAAQSNDTASVVVLLSTLPQAPRRHCTSLSEAEHAECAARCSSAPSSMRARLVNKA